MRFSPYQLWLDKEVGGFIALIAISSVVVWLSPDKYSHKVGFGLLAIGILFDLSSVFSHVMTMVTGKFTSGFPLIGLIFYTWFLLASPFSLMGWGHSELRSILLFKIADAVVLLGFHLLCQLPMFLQKPRSEYK